MLIAGIVSIIICMWLNDLYEVYIFILINYLYFYKIGWTCKHSSQKISGNNYFVITKFIRSYVINPVFSLELCANIFLCDTRIYKS